MQSLRVAKRVRNQAYLFFKRLFDIIIGFIGSLFLLPLAIVIKLAYLCTGDFHSIFYTQTRIGQAGKPFKFLKFRSMVINADEILNEQLLKNPKLKTEYETNKKLRHDPRVTKVGRFIRRLSIDELPQLLNVLHGDMSLIGNRPYLPREKKDMRKYFSEITKTKPGITGLWQVSGHNDVPFKSRLEIESLYSEQQSLPLDFHIFLRTFTAVIQGGSKQ